jgi:lipopolysaccharide transport system ATP-binding protein
MSQDIAIKVENLSKVYPLRQPYVDENGQLVNEHWALKDVSFEIKKGESVGIIGPNGSGKSTLLKILAGVTKPTSGKVTISGKVASILDIGAGFHPELSGRENVFLNGQIHGFSKKEIEGKFDEIVAFSGIEKFIDEPVKNYSNGMYLRLAFSIMVHLDFDVYLLDEVMSVGDADFREKIANRLCQFLGSKTLLIVTHEPQLFKQQISRTIFFGKKTPWFETANSDLIQDYLTKYIEKNKINTYPFVFQLESTKFSLEVQCSLKTNNK